LQEDSGFYSTHGGEAGSVRRRGMESGQERSESDRLQDSTLLSGCLRDWNEPFGIEDPLWLVEWPAGLGGSQGLCSLAGYGGATAGARGSDRFARVIHSAIQFRHRWVLSAV